MDTKMALEELGLAANNVFYLTKSDAPNSISKWFGPDTQPTQSELDAAWTSFQSKNPDFGKTTI